MTGFEIGALTLGAGNFVGNLLGQKSASDASQEAIDFNKWAYQTAMQREDNAIQRRVGDLRAAGLSPTLAAGSAAASMSPISVGPRQIIDPSAAMAAAIQPTLAMSQLRQTDAQIDATRAQADATRYDTASKNWHDQLTALFFPKEYEQKIANIGKTYADTGVSSAEAGLRRADLRRDIESGQAKGTLGSQVHSMVSHGAKTFSEGNLIGNLAEIGVPGYRAKKLLQGGKR